MEEKLMGDYFSRRREIAFFVGNDSRRRHVFMICGWFIPPKSEVQHGQLWT